VTPWLEARRFLPLIEEAWLALRVNRLRSALTVLGVVIGVASVVLMLAIGEGSRRRVAESISSLGTNRIIVMSGAPSTNGMRGSTGGLPTLTLDDASAIGELRSVRAVAPVAVSSAQVVRREHNRRTSVTGTTAAYLAVNGWTVAEGGTFSDADVRAAANVAVIGETVRKDLLGDLPQGESAVGQTLRIQRQTFQVIGVLKAKGQGFDGQDQDDTIILPVTTAQRKLSGTTFPGSVSMVLLESSLPDQKGYTEEEVTRLLRQRHRIGSARDDDFTVRDMSVISETLQLTSTVLGALLAAIAFVSLLVGGIGIMNIMLVSVTERTREIGVRMAVGGARSWILAQFVLEALLLSVVGALLGLATGVGVGVAAGATGVVTVDFSVRAMALAFSVAVVVGVVFGWWPARRAAALEPVEALRYQ
jgi:putative ABC transport system permease protein